MGLAASQARLLMITARKDDVESKLMRIANQRLSLSRESADISEAYSNALNATKLVMNAGNASTDLTYAALMNPATAGLVGQYMVTDYNNRVVLSEGMISQLGIPSSGAAGDLANTVTRNSFLQRMMGATEAEATDYVNNTTAAASTTDGSTTSTAPVSGLDNSNGQLDYLKQQMALVRTYEYTDQNLANSPYWSDADKNARYTGMTTALNNMLPVLQQESAVLGAKINSISGNSLVGPAATDPNRAQYDLWVKEKAMVDQMIKDIPNALAALQKFIENSGSDGEEWFAVANDILFSHSVEYSVKGGHDEDQAQDKKTSLGYSHGKGQGYQSAVDDVLDKLQNSYENNKSSSDTDDAGSATTNPNQATANYYLNLYNAINSRGWSSNSFINDKTYLQNGLLSGALNLLQYSNGGWGSAMSSSTSSISSESDDEAIAKAEANYEAAKDKLDYKEARLDIQKNDLDTERSALDTEVDSVKAIIDKNIERSFKMFQA